jgi:hypothetical protein
VWKSVIVSHRHVHRRKNILAKSAPYAVVYLGFNFGGVLESKLEEILYHTPKRAEINTVLRSDGSVNYKYVQLI